jgi:ABC-type bacteriocin/lantibiotic exporter with double-glycine peptidase domain
MKGVRRRLVPEVVQTSSMDCGPAALKSLLEGFGIQVSYGRLRDACQTDVDGTSIDALEDIALRIGLDVEQHVVPGDHWYLPEAKSLPALVVVRLPNGFAHFVVVWSVHLLGGPDDSRGFVQVMDPGAGRRWVSLRDFKQEVYRHAMAVPADGWRGFATSPPFQHSLARRLRRLGIATHEALLAEALNDPSWRSIGALDAATRLTGSLVAASALKQGDEAERVLRSFLSDALATFDQGLTQDRNAIPTRFWSVLPYEGEADPEAGEQVMIVGAVALVAHGLRTEPATDAPALPPEIVAALAERDTPTFDAIWNILREDGALRPAMLAAAVAIATFTALAESVLFRSLFELAHWLGDAVHRLTAVVALLLFFVAVLVLELPLQLELQRIGRALENRLRIAFLTKIPRLNDRYFQSRPMFDMTERGHSVQQLRTLPSLASGLVRSVGSLVVTALGIVWIAPSMAFLCFVTVALSIGIPLALQRPLTELDLRVRAHGGALGRFFLDTLLGLTAVRTHGAERAMRREHESLLVEWARSARSLQISSVGLEAIELVVGVAMSVTLMLLTSRETTQNGSVLLLAYWALNVPALGHEVAQLARQYPDHRAATMRLLEPLGAIEDESAVTPDARAPGDHVAAALNFDHVTVRAGGHTLLEDVTVRIDAGSHVGIVGTSGAGKSSLVGLLLGWHTPSVGTVTVDGETLQGMALAMLRREIIWVDPSVHLWNRSLLDNLLYGSAREGAVDLADVLHQADLHPVLEHLPEGMQTSLGESGALVSGGEGQRVRLARGMLRERPRLVILDEPFRGLDRTRRSEFLTRCRTRWSAATLLFVTHDIHETLTLPRVLVVEGGHVVEDGDPQVLAANPDSRYRALLDAEDAVRVGLWSDASWRRVRLEGGSLHEGHS